MLWCVVLCVLQTATDTQKNTVYVVAKRMSKRCTIEQYAIALAQHFVHTYPRVRGAGSTLTDTKGTDTQWLAQGVGLGV